MSSLEGAILACAVTCFLRNQVEFLPDSCLTPATSFRASHTLSGASRRARRRPFKLDRAVVIDGVTNVAVPQPG